MLSRILRRSLPFARQSAFNFSVTYTNEMYDKDHDLSINEKTREAYWDDKGKRVEWFKPYTQVSISTNTRSLISNELLNSTAGIQEAK